MLDTRRPSCRRSIGPGLNYSTMHANEVPGPATDLALDPHSWAEHLRFDLKTLVKQLLRKIGTGNLDGVRSTSRNSRHVESQICNNQRND